MVAYRNYHGVASLQLWTSGTYIVTKFSLPTLMYVLLITLTHDEGVKSESAELITHK